MSKLRKGMGVRVIGEGYMQGWTGVIEEAPTSPDPNRPLLETAWATVRFEGGSGGPSRFRIDPEILEPVQ